MSLRFINFLLVLASSALTADAGAITRYVSPCGSDAWAGVSFACSAPLGPKRTIQAAINASVDGDQISVFPGTYVGAIDLDGKAVHILGLNGPNTTIVDGNGAPHTVTCNSSEAADTVIEGLRITGGNAVSSYGGGMLLNFASPTVINCHFAYNDATVGGGGASVAAGSPHFIDCLFLGNHANVAGGGVYTTASTAVFEGCDFVANDTDAYGGGVQFVSGNCTLVNCTIRENESSDGGGLRVFNGMATIEDTTIEDNEASAHGGGLSVWDSTVEMTGSDVINNISRQAGGGINLANGATLNITQATISGNTIDPSDDVFGYGGGFRVNNSTLTGTGMLIVGNHSSNGGGLFATNSEVNLTDALIWLNEASEDSGGLGADSNSNITLTDVDVVANDSPVSGGIATTGSTLIMSGGSITDHTSHYASALGVGQGSVHFQSVVIENNASIGFVALGTITLVDLPAGAAEFVLCDFIDNSGGVAGGAVYLTDAHVNFDACEFSGNSAAQGGAIAADNLEGPNVIELRACQFQSNLAHIGGALTVNGDTELLAAYCQFSSNHANHEGGAISSSAAAIHLVNCDVHGNTADAGAGIALASIAPSAMTNCRMTDNAAQEQGGALSIGSGANFAVTNCTITENQASQGGSAISMGNADVNVVNCIVWGNQGAQVNGTGTPDFRYSIVPPLQSGPGCFTSNPQFQNPGIGDYRLAANSPARDAGNNAQVPDDILDIDSDDDDAELLPLDRFNTPRIQIAVPGGGCGGLAIVDMGAFEAAGETPKIIISSADLNGDGVVNGVDLGILLNSWGAVGSGCGIADLNADGVVNGVDLGILLGSWD